MFSVKLCVCVYKVPTWQWSRFLRLCLQKKTKLVFTPFFPALFPCRFLLTSSHLSSPALTQEKQTWLPTICTKRTGWARCKLVITLQIEFHFAFKFIQTYPCQYYLDADDMIILKRILNQMGGQESSGSGQRAVGRALVNMVMKLRFANIAHAINVIRIVLPPCR